MSKQVYPIDEYQLMPNDALLFDANIWLYLYSPQGDRYPRVKRKYNLAFRRIRSAKVPIFIDVLILSEFINAYARFVYNNLPAATKQSNFKAFRNSADFKPVAEQIAKYSRSIVEKSERIDSGFESVDLEEIVVDYAGVNADFNDRMLAELCKAKALKFVTHDADLKGDNLTIITANSILFNKAEIKVININT
ncbi:MAG: PIN domain-containing protein [Hormoscilla sp. GM102CHS1]|nr:PIN domain-containing protein [Hormoscilla sp. GM102CHS1]